MEKIAFIGCGNMGGAMLRRILKGKHAEPAEVLVAD